MQQVPAHELVTRFAQDGTIDEHYGREEAWGDTLQTLHSSGPGPVNGEGKYLVSWPEEQPAVQADGLQLGYTTLQPYNLKQI